MDTHHPNIRLDAFLDESTVTFYLDTSGEPLFKRGHRVLSVEAPLRENLAAGLLRLAGWTPNEVLLDPMCGSGTIPLEAAHDGAPDRTRTISVISRLSACWSTMPNAGAICAKPLD